MQYEELFSKVRTTIADVLDLEDGIEINASTTADDIETWDSLQHVRILISLEKSFGFHFSEHEVQGLKTVGDLVSVVSNRVSSKS